MLLQIGIIDKNAWIIFTALKTSKRAEKQIEKAKRKTSNLGKAKWKIPKRCVVAGVEYSAESVPAATPRPLNPPFKFDFSRTVEFLYFTHKKYCFLLFTSEILCSSQKTVLAEQIWTITSL